MPSELSLEHVFKQMLGTIVKAASGIVSLESEATYLTQRPSLIFLTDRKQGRNLSSPVSDRWQRPNLDLTKFLRLNDLEASLSMSVCLIWFLKIGPIDRVIFPLYNLTRQALSQIPFTVFKRFQLF